MLEAEAQAVSPQDGKRLAELEGRIAALADAVRLWLQSRPEIKATVSSAGSAGLTKASVRRQIRELREALLEIGRKSPESPFNLGRIEVNVTAPAPQVSTASSIDQSEIREWNRKNVADALEMEPGISLQRVGSRNELGVSVRGFDVRQVPFYMDGIPVYVPYDGYVDLSRYQTSDVAELQVSKGFSSPLYGPNAIGGAINLITKEPLRPVNLDLGAGYASGHTLDGFANVGFRWSRFWLQGSAGGSRSDFFPLSGDYAVNPLQPSLERTNSYDRAHKESVRAAWTPKASSQYVFSFFNQGSRKGAPPYAGPDPAVRIRYWKWPEWTNRGVNFSGNRRVGETGYLRARLYYTAFHNLLSAYDDVTYTTQFRRSSFNSPMDDDSYGTILEGGTGGLPAQTLKGSFYYRDDTHREGNIGEPRRSFRERTVSLGVEDTLRLGSRTQAIVGFGVDHLRVLNAEQYIGGEVRPFPHRRIWALNPQAGIFHQVSATGRFYFTFARKTRLPTMKDRYSFRRGRSLPNPDLHEETSDNFEIGYSHLAGTKTFLRFAVFESRISNLIQAYFPAPNIFQLRNVGEAVYLGGEFSLRSSLIPACDTEAGYTYLNRNNTSNPEIMPVNTPRHTVYGSLIWRPWRRLQLLGGIRYEAGRWTQNDAGRLLRASQFADLSAGGILDMGQGIRLHIGIRNLFDRNYFLEEGYPEPGRTAFVNLRYSF